HPLAELQKKGRQDDDKYTILRDTIHCTDPAYIAWGYYIYERLNPAVVERSTTLNADARVVQSKRCQVVDIKADKSTLTFTRIDEVLPMLPPGQLPPRKYVPLEQWSPYLLRVVGLPKGGYEIRCEGKLLGRMDDAALASGFN